MYNEHENGAEDLVQVRWRTFTKLLCLKLSPLLRYICVSELSQPAACSLPSHYLNQFCFIANWTITNKFDMNMKRCIFAHSTVISLLYLFVCMYISYKAHNRFTKEALLIVSDVDVYMFPVLRSIPSCTTDMNLRSCILNRHKMRQSQIATIQESLPSHFVICRILWSWPWRHILSPITLKTCSGYLGEYPCSLLTWIWKVSFLPILALFHCYICLCVCISVIKPIIDLQRKPYW